MEGKTIGFMIWCIGGMFFIGIAIYIWFSKKAIGFWGNAKMFEVTDIKKYNHAMSKLYAAYGIIFILLGLPILSGQNSPWILLSVVGVMAESIALMAIYSLVIEKKYRK